MYYWQDEPEAIECIASYERGHNYDPGPNPMLLSEYLPVSTLTLKRTPVPKAKFPLIDGHHHMHSVKLEDLPAGVKLMDDMNIQSIVNLDGGTTLSCVKRSIDCLDRTYPGRFFTYCNIETPDIDAPDFESHMRAFVTEGAKYGVRGLKLLKEMGLKFRDSKGELILPDDDRLRFIWELAAKLGLPVLYHIADPLAFFRPNDGSNERVEPLWQHPDWHFYGPGVPTFEQMMECQERLLENNPDTTFILPHAASRTENLASLDALLERYGNFYIDISARAGDLSKTPYSSRKFLIKHAGRTLFGLDGPLVRRFYEVFFRILETDDEYFNYKNEENRMAPGARYS